MVCVELKSSCVWCWFPIADVSILNSPTRSSVKPVHHFIIAVIIAMVAVFDETVSAVTSGVVAVDPRRDGRGQRHADVVCIFEGPFILARRDTKAVVPSFFLELFCSISLLASLLWDWLSEEIVGCNSHGLIKPCPIMCSR